MMPSMKCWVFEKVAQLLDRNIIELAPLAYMRGRTLNESFVILDEAQNTTVVTDEDVSYSCRVWYQDGCYR